MPDESHDITADVKELFAALLDFPHDQRAAALDAADVSTQVRIEVRALLDAHRSADRFLSDPDLTTDRLASRFGRDVPERIGPYQIGQQIGQGGFGSVYLAEQRHPIHRRVAIKLIRAGMDSAQVTARFNAERDALAMMDHPNVARVIDAGSTASGLPYFVMELVDGQSITAYADDHRLTTRQRLELFRDVCSAVQHAHQKGVIHRDLKPSNVMVTTIDGLPVVKVIDFGVAKALHGSTHGALTLDRQFIGTPEYMSPEQAMSASDIDTRSDVYGLGVLLYELIVGKPPFDPKELRERAIDEIVRLIREVNPPRPSRRLATELGSVALASARGTDPGKLKTLLQSELDWIVMCCLSKERERRYESAAALSADVERFLTGQAINAHPPTRLYRLQKFARRYRATLTVAAVVVLSLALGLTIAVIGLREAQRERDAAVKARAREADARIIAQQSGLFLRDMFGSIDPDLARGRTVSVREVLDDGAARIAGAFPEQPIAEAAVRDVFAWAYLRIGDESRSQLQFDHAERLLADADPRDPTRLSVLTGAGETLHGLGRLDESETRLRESLKLHIESRGEADPETWRARSALCQLLLERAKYDESLVLINAHIQSIESAATATSRRVEQYPQWFAARTLQAYAIYLLGNPVEAKSKLADVRASISSSLGPENVLLTQVMLYQAAIDQELNRFADARIHFEEALSLSAKLLGRDHPRTLYLEKEVAMILATTGSPNESADRLESLLSLARGRFGEDHPFTLGVQSDLAVLTITWLRDYPSAVTMYAELATRWERTMGPDHPNTLGALGSHGHALAESGHAAEAEPLLQNVVSRLEKTYGPSHSETSSSRLRLAKTLFKLQRFEEALVHFRIAYESVKAEGRIAQAYQYSFGYGECLSKMDRWHDALPILLETEASMLAFPKQSRTQMLAIYTLLATSYDRLSETDKAAEARAKLEHWRASSRPASAPTS